MTTLETVITDLGLHYRVNDLGDEDYLIQGDRSSADVGQVGGYIEDVWGAPTLSAFRVEDYASRALTEGWLSPDELEGMSPATVLRLATKGEA